MITDIDAGRSLSFEWTLLGAPSRVTLTLEPDEQDGAPVTNVSVAHVFGRLPDGPRPKELVDDWWRFTLGNLMAHAAGAGEVLWVDFGDPSPEIHLSMFMEATPERVFRALTEPAQLDRWMAKDARVDLREGGRYDLGFAPEGYDGPMMSVLDFEPNRRLTISWPDWRGDRAVPVQTVTWLLEPEGTGTRVTLVHAGFVRAVDLSDYPFGWGYFLRRLRGMLEEG